jgi:nucleoside 2-deoxyribosyltransferase
MRPPTTVYFAAPLFNDMERRFNLELAHDLEGVCRVFLPQRDGGLMMELVKHGTPPSDAAKIVFEKDRQAMESADMLVAILDGAKIDEGVAFEIGYMFSLGKCCIGLQTDMRRALPTGNNPMIEASLAIICDSRQGLISAVTEHCLARRDQNTSCGLRGELADTVHLNEGQFLKC